MIFLTNKILGDNFFVDPCQLCVLWSILYSVTILSLVISVIQRIKINFEFCIQKLFHDSKMQLIIHKLL